MIYHLNAPAVHHHRRRAINLVHQLWNALALVAAAPSKATRQIISCGRGGTDDDEKRVIYKSFYQLHSTAYPLTRSQGNDPNCRL